MYRKLGRDSSARKALFRGMLTSFFQYDRIETTEAKAKELRGLADQMITLAKRGDLHARRQVLAYLMDEEVVKKLFDEIAPKYAERQGGYTRVIKTGLRKGDPSSVGTHRARIVSQQKNGVATTVSNTAFLYLLLSVRLLSCKI